jgi:hypothetical protein
VTPEQRAAALASIALARQLGLPRRRADDMTPEERKIDRAYYLFCHGCGGHSSNFMVRDEVWAAAGFERNGWITCLACLETALGRPLDVADFPDDIPVNSSILFGYAMGRRGS